MDEAGIITTRILVLGPLPPPIGGTRVSFKILVEALAGRSDAAIRVIPLPPARKNKLRAAGHLLRQAYDLLRYTPGSDVVALHCGTSALPVRVAMTSAIARLFGKPLVVRTFGGDPLREDSDLVKADRTLRALRKADLYLGQTRKQVEEAREEGVKRVEWFPTSRPMPALDEKTISDNRPCRRFVFLSHVKESKGILQLIEAGERFGDDVSVDVYGPFRDGMTEEVFANCRRVRYCGPVEPDNVLNTLSQYDASLLPTFMTGEGYPGIVIESYAVGLPVICTRWHRLPELVDERSGILVEPRSADALYDAMKQLVDDPAHFAKLRRGAVERRKEFDANVWSERFVQYCRETALNHRAKMASTD